MGSGRTRHLYIAQQIDRRQKVPLVFSGFDTRRRVLTDRYTNGKRNQQFQENVSEYAAR